jgi:hypothetical protein
MDQMVGYKELFNTHQMVGYEKLFNMRAIGNGNIKNIKNNNNNNIGGGDTSSTNILVGVADFNTANGERGNELRCWNCDKPGHSMHKCTELSVDDKKTLHQDFHANGVHSNPNKFKSKKSTTDVMDNASTISKAVMLHLGGTCIPVMSSHDIKNINTVDEDEDEEEQIEIPVFDTFCFAEIGIVHNDPVLRSVIIEAGNAVKKSGSKIVGWADVLIFKFNSIGIVTAGDLHSEVKNSTLNAKLKNGNHPALFSDTLIALSDSTALYAEISDIDAGLERIIDSVDQDLVEAAGEYLADTADELLELCCVIRNMSIIHCKTNHKLWTNQVFTKLESINVNSTSVLQHYTQSGTLNSTLSGAGLNPFNKGTITGFRSELNRAHTGDQSRVPSPVLDFC